MKDCSNTPITLTRQQCSRHHPTMRSLIGLVGVILALDVPACTKTNPAFCCTSPVDCAASGLMGTSTSDCTDGFVCVDHGCTTPPPIDAAIPDASPECTIDHDCAASKPFCSPERACVGCLTSDECPTAMPTCDATTSSCRTCETNSDCASAVCDVDLGTCTASTRLRPAQVRVRSSIRARSRRRSPLPMRVETRSSSPQAPILRVWWSRTRP